MPPITPQASRSFEFQIMHPTFEDSPIAEMEGDLVPGLRHIGSYFYEGTKTDTIGNMLPVVLAALSNEWVEDGKVFRPWFNDQNIKLTPYAMNIIKAAGGLRSFRKGDAVRLVGSGYEEQNDDVNFYDTEGKKVSTYIFDGEGFRTTYRRLAVSHAITLEEPQEDEPEPEQAPEPEVDASGEAPAAEATAGASTEGFEHGIEVGMEIEATSSAPGVPPQRGIVVAVEKDKVTIKREDGQQVTMNIPPKATLPPVPPPPPPKPNVPPPPPPAEQAEDDEEEEGEEEESVYLPTEYEEVAKGDEVMVMFKDDEPLMGIVTERDPEGMFVKPADGSQNVPIPKAAIEGILKKQKKGGEEVPPPQGEAAAEAPADLQLSPQLRAE